MNVPQFTPRLAGDPPPPHELRPRCHVANCTRVVYKSVVCRKHWDALPIELRLQRMKDAMLGAVAATATTDQDILGLTEGMS